MNITYHGTNVVQTTTTQTDVQPRWILHPKYGLLLLDYVSYMDAPLPDTWQIVYADSPALRGRELYLTPTDFDACALFLYATKHEVFFFMNRSPFLISLDIFLSPPKYAPGTIVGKGNVVYRIAEAHRLWYVYHTADETKHTSLRNYIDYFPERPLLDWVEARLME